MGILFKNKIPALSHSGVPNKNLDFFLLTSKNQCPNLEVYKLTMLNVSLNPICYLEHNSVIVVNIPQLPSFITKILCLSIHKSKQKVIRRIKDHMRREIFPFRGLFTFCRSETLTFFVTSNT